MNIAMIGHKSIYSCEGGIEKTVRNLSLYLTEKGHAVTVYDRGIYYRKGFASGGLSDEFQKQVAEKEALRVVRIPTVSGAGEVPLYSFFAAVRAAFSRHDVVIFHASGPCLMIPIVKLFGKKTIAFIHGLDSQSSKWGNFASKYLAKGEKTAAKKADELLVLSEHIRDYLKEKYGREALLTINGIKAPFLADAETEKAVLAKYGLQMDGYFFWSGRLSPEKGLQYLIPAFLSLKTDKKLALAGEIKEGKGSYYHKIRPMCDNNTDVCFLGSRRQYELQILYRNAFAFVFPSEQEGMAHSLLEAMVNDAACILSDIPENQSVAGAHALYFESKCVPDLTEKMKALLAHPEKRAALTEGQKEEILLNYSLEKSGEQMLALCSTRLQR